MTIARSSIGRNASARVIRKPGKGRQAEGRAGEGAPAKRGRTLRTPFARPRIVSARKKRRFEEMSPEEAKQSREGYIALCLDIMHNAFSLVELKWETPENQEYQETVTFLLNDQSPVHQILFVERECIELALGRIYNGEEVANGHAGRKRKKVSAEHLDRILRMTHGDLQEAAQILGVRPSSIRRMATRRGLNLDAYRGAA